MNFLVISHVKHKQKNNQYYGYGPYVKEMNLWLKYVDSVEVVAPLIDARPDKIDLPYIHNKLTFTKVPSFNLIGVKNKIFTILTVPYIFFKIIYSMRNADHIHLRCPGNMGLLGTIAQIFFPKKIKTVKYAGNWDPKSMQPKSYILQKNIISNEKLSKNLKVLVYGEWENQTKNIFPFFTASYSKNEVKDVKKRDLTGTINLLFVGSLSPGKQPMTVLKVVKKLKDNGFKIHLDFCGEGIERERLENYIKENSLNNVVTLHGNQNASFVKKMYQKSHFLILMSRSEGWPKVVAEAMFWGCVPISSNVSCVNYMIGYGTRGNVVSANVQEISDTIFTLVKNEKKYNQLSLNGIHWSRRYTLEYLEAEIRKLING